MKKRDTKQPKEEKRTVFFGAVRLTKTEYNLVKKDFETSEYHSRSAYMRGKIFARELSEMHTKRHQAFLEAAKMNTEINRIGNNFNQLMHAINTYKVVELRPYEFKIIQELGQKLAAIQQIFEDIEM